MTDQPTLRTAYGPLAALLVEMRADWNLDQVIRELVGCPWSPRLVHEAFIAARDDPSQQLRVRDAVIKVRSQQQQLTPEQVAAYRAHAQRIISRRPGGDA
ncbi:hypothetical protein [Nonomuraea cavernae]|uniref:Uncharacterized protein n=1 Tax=Nonomuraea cavernae TaxID=2045107 RepID=A0A918DF27_9ACTN|nr:hypothetical protein [Nonomuraea cavernae]MCA2184668.1 hypothetical protein [Nonomuraea cavernae]GGO63119.1 hypothetical protein GCM10012289_09300 [Nonomuraea cavernae]